MPHILVWYDLTTQSTLKDSQCLLLKACTLCGTDGQVTAAFAAQTLPDKDCFWGANRVIYAQVPDSTYQKAQLLAQMLTQYAPDIVLFSATAKNSQIASFVAAWLTTGLCAECTDLRIEDGVFIMHRPAFGGGVEADIICPKHRPQMATVRLGIYNELLTHSMTSDCSLVQMQPVWIPFSPGKLQPDPLKLISATKLPAAADIRQASAIVAGGLGIGSKENFQVLHRLANALGAQVGATRAAVDAGYADWSCQIGQTGQIVQPKLYLAFGISGAVQHIAGMHRAKTVIAINTDPHAPIFSYADYAITATWREVAETMIASLEV